MIDYCVVDLETSIKNRGDESVGDFKASPFHPDNQIVMSGWKFPDDDHVKIMDYAYGPTVMSTSYLTTDMLVGQNIGFDLLYLYRSAEWRKWAKTGRIWDTMIVEYLLSGQDIKYPNLDYLAKKYGGTLKPDKIKKYWEEGIDTEDIPHKELKEYLIGDVVNTEIVFLGQLKEAERLGMLPLIHEAMEARMATIEMEWNGMYFDVDLANRLCQDLDFELTDILAELKETMTATTMAEFEWNPSSSKHLSAYLFGDVITYDSVEVVKDDAGNPYKYKTGKKAGEIKTRKVKKTQEIIGLLDGNRYSENGKTQWATGEDVLKKVVNESTSSLAVTICSLLLRARELDKDISSYYVGYPKLTWPTDNCIHPSYNHAATGTGRLSCSKPNLQQVSSTDE